MVIKQVFRAIKESGSSIESKKTMSGIIVLYSYGNKYSFVLCNVVVSRHLENGGGEEWV